MALEVNETVEEEVVPTATKGGQHKEVLDSITGQRLNPGVETAREREMVYIRRQGVFAFASEERVQEVTGKAPISVGWVDVNKGDESRPELRGRLVAQETKCVATRKPQDAASVFAATPPLGALRFATTQARAPLHSPVRREVFVSMW